MQHCNAVSSQRNTIVAEYERTLRGPYAFKKVVDPNLHVCC